MFSLNIGKPSIIHADSAKFFYKPTPNSYYNKRVPSCKDILKFLSSPRLINNIVSLVEL